MHKIRAWGGSPQPSLHHLQSETPRGYSTAGLGLSRQLDIPLTIQDTWFLTDTPPAVLVTPNYLPYQPGCPNCPPTHTGLVILHYPPLPTWLPLTGPPPAWSPPSVPTWSPHSACCLVIWLSFTNPPASLVAPGNPSLLLTLWLQLSWLG